LNESAFFIGQRNAIVGGSSNVDDPGAGGTFSLKISGGAATVSSGIRKLPNEHKNVSLNVFATGSVTLTNLAGSTVAEITSGQMAQCISLGDGEWVAVARDNKFPKVIDFSLYGTPDDDEYDNTPALEEALADAYEAGGASIWFGSGREWHFLTALNSNNAATYRHYENVSLEGISPEFTAQHQEESGVGIDLDNTFGTRLVLNLTAGSVWWNVQRTYRFGPTRITNLSLFSETQITAFRIGGLDGVEVTAAFRGLYVNACYFSCQLQTWLDYDATNGYTLPANLGYAFDLTRGYDVVMTDVAFRGWGGAAIRDKGGDHAVFRNCRSISCQLLEEVQIVGSAGNVPPVIQHCYAEACPYYGVVTEGGLISALRGEMGYNSSELFDPDIGNIPLPVAITWSIQIAADELIFDDETFPGVMDATNYFRPHSIVKITPTQEAGSTVPPRYLYITEVAADRLTFTNSTGSSYVQLVLSGTGTDIERVWGIPLVVVGDRSSVNGFSLEINESTEIPVWAFVPSKKLVEINGCANTVGANEQDFPTTYQPLIVASSAGTQNLWGGVKINSRYNAPDHPLSCFDEGPEYTPNWRGPIWDEAGERQIFMPGRGIGTSNNVSRLLRFRRVEDTELGIDVWVYLLSDSAIVGWEMRPLRKNNVAARYVVRCYASEATTLSVYGGEGSANEHPLTEGWHTVTGTSHGDDAILATGQLLADGTGPFIALGGLHISVAKVTVTQ
jgi:hypothetical protein